MGTEAKTATEARAGIDEARGYLARNAELRRAAGIAPDAPLEPRHLGEGEHNRNYRFDDPETGRAFVLRVNVLPQPFHDNQVRYEYEALRALAPSGRTPQPVYLDDGADAPGCGAMVIGFCDGDELDFDRLQPGDLDHAARILADVHAAPVPTGCPLHRPADPLRDLFDECMERYRVYRASAFENARITAWADRFIAAARGALETAPDPADGGHIVNTEPLASHFLLPRTGAPDDPGWFVDWERPIVGEVAQDLAYFVAPTTTFWDSERLFTADEADAFVEAYWNAVDGRFPRGAFDARFRAFRLMTALRSMTWCCKALIRYQGGAARAHTTGKTARKLPIYLSDEFLERIAAECLAL